MDTATPTSTDAPEDAVVSDPPSIRVPPPVSTELSRPPAAVPSMTVPDTSLPTTPLRIAPLPASSAREAPPATNGVTESAEVTSLDPPATEPTPSDQAPQEPHPSDQAPPDQAPPAPAPTGFSPHVAAKLRSYVYLLVDPRSGRAFCVAVGRGDRCFRHVAAAGDAHEEPLAETTGRLPNFAMLDRIRQIEADGRPVRIDILRYGLSTSEAALVAASTGDALGLPVQPDLRSQRCSATEVGSLLAKRAKFKREHQVVLLRVGGAGADPAYERARHGWRVGRRWIDLDSPRSPQWAVVVVADLITSVYRIERWEPTPAKLSGRGGRTAAPIGRYSLVGTPDPELEDRYVGKRVTAYLGHGAPSPVTYVRCGPHWVNTAQ